ncbi:MAG: hypothetical protein JWO98_2326 [Frankiales bacterium]|nr:hypothetical protein [Frankiales bacterium]
MTPPGRALPALRAGSGLATDWRQERGDLAEHLWVGHPQRHALGGAGGGQPLGDLLGGQLRHGGRPGSEAGQSRYTGRSEASIQ